MYIGGLYVEKMPCDCGAPYAETYVDENGKIGCTLHMPRSENALDVNGCVTYPIYDTICDDRDDLQMVCTRCGIDATKF